MQNWQEIPKDVQEKLRTLLEKDPMFLSDSDREFLRARESYLTEEEKGRVFREIKDAEVEESAEPKQKRKLRKNNLSFAKQLT
jgi:hypothetical protein